MQGTVSSHALILGSVVVLTKLAPAMVHRLLRSPWNASIMTVAVGPFRTVVLHYSHYWRSQ